MKTSHIFWGTLFIVFGLLVLINNYAAILMDWSLIWKLWPLVIILLGISIILKHKAGKGVLAGLAAIILALAIFGSIKTLFYVANNDFEISLGGKNQFSVSEYSDSYSDSTKYATFNFDGGAGKFILTDTTTDLIYSKSEGVKDNYSFSSMKSDSTAEINLDMKNTKITFGHNYKNRVEINLNPTPVWNLNFDVGAAAMEFDLRQFRVNEITVGMGAAALDLTIGSLQENTKVSIEAGASSITIRIPENAGCEVTTDAALSSKHLPGFNEVESGNYRSSNFDNSTQKIYIEIECGVSSINVKRY